MKTLFYKLHLEKHGMGILLLAWLFIIYSPVLMAPKIVNPDAFLILPLLQQYNNLFDYFTALIQFNTYDVQPIRDLTLYVDLFIYEHTQVNTAIFQNIIYWWLSIIVIYKIISEIRPDLSQFYKRGIVALFAVYPLFSATINYGIARKHILAFLFILLATYFFLQFIRNDFENKSASRMTLFYFLSIFSQPITILWPVWINIYLFLKSRQDLRIQKKLSVIYLLCLICLASNYFYYKLSPVFKLSFGSKTGNAFNFPDKTLGLGHYFYQLILPYWPATSYRLGHWSVLLGLVFVVILFSISYKFSIHRKWLLCWGSFMLFPLFVVLVQPHFLSDTYLLTPAFALLILLLGLNCRVFDLNKYSTVFIFTCILITWSWLTYSDSQLWTDQIAFHRERDFLRRPNCDSAIIYGSKNLAEKGFFPLEVQLFMENEDCTNLSFSNPGQLNRIIVMNTHILYHDKNLSLESKIDRLKEFTGVSLYAKLVSASISAQLMDKEKVVEKINELDLISKKVQWPQYYDQRIIPLHNYCVKKKMNNCLKLTRHYNKEVNSPFFN